MLSFLAAALFIGIPLIAVAWADYRQHGGMPSLTMPAGEPWPPRGPAIWSLDYACGCTRFRHGQPVFHPFNVHEARLGRWST